MKFCIGPFLAYALLLGGGSHPLGQTGSIVVLAATIEEFPDCFVTNFDVIGDGDCDEGEYNTEECGWDGGDCPEHPDWPGCHVKYPDDVGDGYCRGGDYNTEACGWDGGDCPEHPDWPGCHVKDFERVGDGTCNGGPYMYNTAECGWDGGDCLELNAKYPDCRAIVFSEVGNGKCVFERDSSEIEYEQDLIYSEKCGWDGGDCPTPSGFPHCHLVPSYGKAWEDYDDFDVAANCLRVGDGVCNPGQHNTFLCGWDGGDCIEVNKINPPPGWPGNPGTAISPQEPRVGGDTLDSNGARLFSLCGISAICTAIAAGAGFLDAMI